MKGEPADVYLVRNGRFPPQAVLDIARQMAAALMELEGRGGCMAIFQPPPC